VNSKKSPQYKTELANAIWGFFCVIDSFATSAVYTCYIQPSFTTVYNNTLKFAILPAYAFDACISAIASWYVAHIQRNVDGSLKTGKVVYAAVTTAAALAMVGAAVVGIFAQIKFAFLSSLFFAANMTINAFYNLGASIFYLGKYAGAATDQSEASVAQKKLYRDKAIGHGIAGVLGTCMSLIAILVVPLAKTVLAPVGVVLGVIGMALNTLAMVKSIQKVIALHKQYKASKVKSPAQEVEVKPQPVNTAGIQKQLPPTNCSKPPCKVANRYPRQRLNLWNRNKVKVNATSERVALLRRNTVVF
jgi:hypothetical protein